MVFASSVFLFLFFPLTLLLYYAPFTCSRAWRNGVLLAMSLVFYAWGEPVFVLVMLLSVWWNRLCALQLDKYEAKRPRKAWLCAAIVPDVALLFLFKYLRFAFEQLGLLLGAGDIPRLNIELPVGISFFTFQIMSYVFDVYYKKTVVQKSYAHLALYISMFPQLIAGPIVRYSTVAEEIVERIETQADFTRGTVRFVQGLAKKVLLANYLALIADNVFAFVGTPYTVATAWLGAVAYSMQIYYDFSGYSDMAIGMGLMFGFHFSENFNYSFTADSISDFWRRQHISLSQWFRDYVYIPLGGSRVPRARWVWNIFVVWALTGMWHGANWTYIVWGLYYFVLLVFEKFSGFPARVRRHRVLCHAYALLFTAIGMVLFRAENFSDTLAFIGNMLGLNAAGLSDGLFAYYISAGKWVLLAGMVFATPVLPWLDRKMRTLCRSRTALAVYELCVAAGLCGVLALCVIVCVKSAYNPFIYFNF